MRALVLALLVGCGAARKPPPPPPTTTITERTEPAPRVDEHSSDWIRHVVEPPGTKTR